MHTNRNTAVQLLTERNANTVVAIGKAAEKLSETRGVAEIKNRARRTEEEVGAAAA
ncbi:hypothetical protein A2U01_0035016 [Trifolium medium]|uniref:Uncharacterized protein n=1 Tax=Trifolium medium TaxID=97028 RepID=A0A392PPY5_9FABA|nr:hypothetical protein [Trifolium medium]